MNTTTLERQKVPAEVERTRSGKTYLPVVDIRETKEELVLFADLPGVKPDGVDIHFEGGELTITGRVEPRQPDGTRYLLLEYETGDFARTFRISESIDASRISAELKDGVLTLHLPKVEAVKPRKIAVKTV